MGNNGASAAAARNRGSTHWVLPRTVARTPAAGFAGPTRCGAMACGHLRLRRSLSSITDPTWSAQSGGRRLGEDGRAPAL